MSYDFNLRYESFILQYPNTVLGTNEQGKLVVVNLKGVAVIVDKNSLLAKTVKEIT